MNIRRRPILIGALGAFCGGRRKQRKSRRKLEMEASMEKRITEETGGKPVEEVSGRRLLPLFDRCAVVGRRRRRRGNPRLHFTDLMTLLTGAQPFPPSFDHISIRPDADRSPWIAEGGDLSGFQGLLIGPWAWPSSSSTVCLRGIDWI